MYETSVDPQTGEIRDPQWPEWARLRADPLPLDLTRRYILLLAMHARRLALTHGTVRPIDLPVRLKSALSHAASSSYGSTPTEVHSMFVSRLLKRLQIPLPDGKMSNFLSLASREHDAPEMLSVIRREVEMLLAYVSIEAAARRGIKEDENNE